MKMRKDTRDWLGTHTLRDARTIATDLENAGEDVEDLLDAIGDLEALVREKPHRGRKKT